MGLNMDLLFQHRGGTYHLNMGGFGGIGGTFHVMYGYNYLRKRERWRDASLGI